MKIKAKAPGYAHAHEHEHESLTINGLLPCWYDVEVFTDDDKPINEIKSIELKWSNSDDPTGPLTAKVEVYISELDIVCEGKVEGVTKS